MKKNTSSSRASRQTRPKKLGKFNPRRYGIFRGKPAVIFMLVFAVIGGYMLFKTFAATAVGQIEAESLNAVSGSAQVTTLSGASAGSVLKMTSAATYSGSFTTTGDGTSLVIRARGDQCSGAPEVSVSFDGGPAKVASVASTSLSNYTISPLPTQAGTHTISATYTNPYTSYRKNNRVSCTRVLYLDVFTVMDDNAGGGTGTTTLNPLADSYVASTAPTSNYATATDLAVDGGDSTYGDNLKSSYLKFDLSSVSGTVTSAKLRVFVSNQSANADRVMNVDSSSWTESGITYSNRPSLGSQIATTSGSNQPGWEEIDVTSAVTAKAGQLFSLAIDNAVGTDGYTFSSKETTNKPELVVTSSTGGADTTAPVTSVTNPANGAALSGTVNVTANASDNVAVSKVEIYIDGNLKQTVNVSPYSYSWDTTSLSNGSSHNIYSKAYDAAGNVGTSSTVTVTVNNSTPTPGGTAPITGTKIWSDDTEDGSVSDEWTLNGGGGLYNSCPTNFVAQNLSTDYAHSGSRSMKHTITTTPCSDSPGLRDFRWDEPRHNRELYYEGWFYMPQQITVNGFWNLYQWKSRPSGNNSKVDPLWAIYGNSDGNGTFVQLGWGFGATDQPGPYSGDSVSGKWITPITKVYLPAGRWVQFAAYMKASTANGDTNYKSSNYDGILKVWIDGKLIHNLSGITTSYANCDYNSLCYDPEWSINHYSDNLTPTTSTIYWDDAAMYRP